MAGQEIGDRYSATQRRRWTALPLTRPQHEQPCWMGMMGSGVPRTSGTARSSRSVQLSAFFPQPLTFQPRPGRSFHGGPLVLLDPKARFSPARLPSGPKAPRTHRLLLRRAENPPARRFCFRFALSRYAPCAIAFFFLQRCIGCLMGLPGAIQSAAHHLSGLSW